MSDPVKDLLSDMEARLVVTKVVASRSVKSRSGDSFVGFSSASDSIQDDGLKGVDSLESFEGGMSLRDASLASLVLGLHADLAAYRNAWAGGGVTREFYDAQVLSIKRNYALLIQELLQGGSLDEQA